MKKLYFILYLILIFILYILLQYIYYFTSFNDIFTLPNNILLFIITLIYLLFIFIGVYWFYKCKFIENNANFIKVSWTVIFTFFVIWSYNFTLNTIPNYDYNNINEWFIWTEVQKNILEKFNNNNYYFWNKNFNIFKNINHENQLRYHFVHQNIDSIENFLNYKISWKYKLLSREWVFLQRLQNDLKNYYKNVN